MPHHHCDGQCALAAQDGREGSRRLFTRKRTDVPHGRGPVGLPVVTNFMIGSSYMAGSSVSEPRAKDSELRLLVPANDVAEPELSIVIPALNEELTIGQFVDWCQEGLRRAKVRGEVLRSEEHTSELQSLRHLVCRLLLEKIVRSRRAAV